MRGTIHRRLISAYLLLLMTVCYAAPRTSALLLAKAGCCQTRHACCCRQSHGPSWTARPDCRRACQFAVRASTRVLVLPPPGVPVGCALLAHGRTLEPVSRAVPSPALSSLYQRPPPRLG